MNARRWVTNAALWLLLPGAIVGVLLLAGIFLRDPARLAHTRDPAWYTWRAQVLMEADPGSLIRNQGPFSMQSGGYRVAAPTLGALITRLGGTHPFTFTKVLMVGLPVLISLTLAAFAFRERGDPLLALLTAVGSYALLLTVPFVGYIDNLLALYLLSVALCFLRSARDGWAARAVVGVGVFLATLTHPTTTLVFVAVVGLAAGLRLVGYRFSFPRAWRVDGPPALAVLAGAVAGAASWRLGLWGVPTGFTDAVLTPPYTEESFRTRLDHWMAGIFPRYTVPFLLVGAAVGVGSVIFALVRRREVDDHTRMSLLWLLPLLGVLGFVYGFVYPYYRFLNTTLAPMLLIGLGAWVVPGLLLRWRWWAKAMAAVALVAIVLVLLVPIRKGVRQWGRYDEWIGREARVAVAAVRAYAEAEPDRPVVIVIHPKPTLQRIWGLTQQFCNIISGPLSGDVAARTLFYFGEPADLVARRPTRTGQPMFDRLSRGFYDYLEPRLEGRPDPVAFYLAAFNPDPTEELPGRELTSDAIVLEGDGLAPPNQQAVELAAREAAREEASLDEPWAPVARRGHLAQIAFAAFLLLVPPGALLAWRLRVLDPASLLALVPGVSLLLSLAAAILVIAVRRQPFGVADAYVSVVLATVVGGIGLWSSLRRRGAHRKKKTVASPQVPDAAEQPDPGEDRHD